MTLAKLIQNPNSTNKYYVPQSRFPYTYRGSQSTMTIKLNDNGKFNISFSSSASSSTYTFPAFDQSVINKNLKGLILGIDYDLRRSPYYAHPYIRCGYYSYELDQVCMSRDGQTVYFGMQEYDFENLKAYALDSGETVAIDINIQLLVPSSLLNLRDVAINLLTDPIGVDSSGQTETNWESAYTVVPTYTVTYTDPSGTNDNVTHRNIDKGSATPAAPAWTRTGYTLTGWNPARASTVTANVTYSAVWTANTYQIQWVDQSGANSTVTNSATYGSTTPAPPTWTRPDYEFGSWIPSVSPTVTKTQQYMAQWATAGSGKLPVTLDRMRVWADANGYPAGTTIADADRMVLTYEQLAELAGVTGDTMAADGKEYVTLEQLREWANSVASTSLSLIKFNQYVSDSRQEFTYDGGTVTVPAGGIKFYLPETFLDITEIGTVAIPPTSYQRIIIVNADTPEANSARASFGDMTISINTDGTVVLDGGLGGNVYFGWYENRDEFTYTAQ